MGNADYLIDMGPRGGNKGGQIVAEGQPDQLVDHPTSLTTKYLAEFEHRFD